MFLKQKVNRCLESDMRLVHFAQIEKLGTTRLQHGTGRYTNTAMSNKMSKFPQTDRSVVA